ncbi:MAG: arsenate reductase ArsC [Candidatus Obscuribacterales bacterium]|nr:arsenate reductase ArsC [Steroidobacteraceae bacterium]
MTDRTLSVLFLCTGNSARSIMAEALLNQIAGNRFKAFSAGSDPSGTVNPFAIDLLRKNKISTDTLRSKSWAEFATPDAPSLDFVITVCDHAAAEVCPIWPGQPLTAHWGVPDPAGVQLDPIRKQRAFFDAFTTLKRRIEIFVSLPVDKIDRMTLSQRMKSIGQD